MSAALRADIDRPFARLRGELERGVVAGWWPPSRDGTAL
jgi:hypothetical protein